MTPSTTDARDWLPNTAPAGECGVAGVMWGCHSETDRDGGTQRLRDKETLPRVLGCYVGAVQKGTYDQRMAAH